jgi:hypothetical protein
VTTNCKEDEGLVEKLLSRSEPQIDFNDASIFIGNGNKTILNHTGGVSKPPFGLNSTATQRPDKPVKLIVIDARSKLAAAGNILKGGGYENEDLYANVKIKFMDIGNIHGIFSFILYGFVWAQV